MDDDQQFCLRWNNHQSTLISVFDTLLENETLVDCTLAAEGRFMKAHKVVLSACSPYFATLLQQQYDKHPIFILKDVKYQELRAMMDYMYRGEVNISQDQLAALLKAAESLQIKGLSDNRSGSGTGSAPRQEIPHQRANIPGGKHGYTLEQTKRARLGPGSGIEQQDIISGSREGSSSPSRRRRKPRRRSIDNDVHDNSNSSANQQPSNASLAGSAITASALASQMSAAAAAVAAASAAVSPAALASAVVSSQQQSGTQQQPQLTTNVPKKTETIKGTTSDAMNNENIQATTSGTAIVGSGAAGVVIGGVATSAGDEQDNSDKVEQKSNHKQKSSNMGKDASTIASGELTIEPKSEYDDEGHDENVEDLTLDEEEMGMDDLDHNAGTSQGGEGSSQGYAAWQHDNRSQDELLLTTQDAQQRDPQGSVSPNNAQITEKDATAAAGGVVHAHEGNSQFKYESQHGIDAYNNESLNFKYDESMQFKSDGSSGERFPCAVCGKSYLRKRHLQRHMRDECIGIPPRFSCDLCPSRFRRKYHMVRHLTSKHGIPPAIAQQTTGNSTRNGGGINNNINGNGNDGAAGGGGAYNGSVNGTDSGCDSPLPENLSMRKENYEHDLNLPSPVDMSNVGAVGGIVSAASPIPPAAHVQCPIPTYGLTGAITAISAAAAVVEEQAAAAAAAAAAGIKLEPGSDVLRVVGGVDSIANAENVVQPEIGATPAAVAEGAATGKTLNMMDDDWKMKLSLHLISNSLLKERLMNTMPFAYNNN